MYVKNYLVDNGQMLTYLTLLNWKKPNYFLQQLLTVMVCVIYVSFSHDYIMFIQPH
jgi:hypothetical protein